MYKGLEQDFSTPETEVGVEDEVVKTLRRAAAEILARGHSRGHICAPDGGVCLWGAINAAMTGDPDRHEPGHSFLTDHAAPLMGFTSAGSAIDWSNGHGRTASAVAARFEFAASSRLAALQGKG